MAAGEEDSAEELLSRASVLVTAATAAAGAARGFAGRWRSVTSRLELLPRCLSDLSTHPCFSKNPLCREVLNSIVGSLSESILLADRCGSGDPNAGRLRMQSDLDSLVGKLDLNIRDCRVLVKTGVLGVGTGPSSSSSSSSSSAAAAPNCSNLGELLARMQIGDTESKHRAMDGILEAARSDETGGGAALSAAIRRSDAAALVQLLSAASKLRDKAAELVGVLLEFDGAFDDLLVSEGAVPPLIRLSESTAGREKAALASLHRLSGSSPDAVREIVGSGGARTLIDLCRTGDSVAQSAAAGSLKNLSGLPEVRQSLAEEGIIRAMVHLLDSGCVPESRDFAAECLQNMTSGADDGLKRCVVSAGGARVLLAHIDGQQEHAVAAIRNLVGSVPMPEWGSLGLLPCLARVLRDGSPGAKEAAASAISRVSSLPETKKMVGESGILPLLIGMLDSKASIKKEAAAQAMASLIDHPAARKEAMKDERCVPCLVQLLDPGPQNTAKKYVVSCLLHLSSSRKCRTTMVSHGAIGYLKKLSDMEVPGAKKLLEVLEQRKLQGLFLKT